MRDAPRLIRAVSRLISATNLEMRHSALRLPSFGGGERRFKARAPLRRGNGRGCARRMIGRKFRRTIWVVKPSLEREPAAVGDVARKGRQWRTE
jgi:hypothetical protein